MSTAHIGRSGPEVTHLGLGGAALAGIYTELDESVARATVEEAWHRGVRYFDTAPVYGAGLAELRLGRALASHDRSEYVLSTKVGYDLVPLAPGESTWDQFPGGLPLGRRFDFSAESTRRSLEQSLERLGTDRVDVVWLHDPDGAPTAGRPAPDGGYLREAMAGAYPVLDDLRTQGVIGAVGVGTNHTAPLLRLAECGDFDAFLLAGRYTLLEQGPLDDLLPVCLDRTISLVVGGPFNSGILATGAVSGSRHDYTAATPEVLERVRALEECCSAHGVPLPTAALQFPLRHQAVVSVIPGVSSPAQMRAAATALTTDVPDDLWDDLRSRGLVHPDSP